MKRCTFLFLAAVILSCDTDPAFDPVAYVDPIIGTAGGGNTYPGAVVPWGMVSVSPHTNPDSKSGYFYGDSTIYGFGHTHLSGTGCQDLGNVTVLPAPQQVDVKTSASTYREEVAEAGFYKVILDGWDIQAEMTATERTGISRYRFSDSGQNTVILKAYSNLSPSTSESFVEITDNLIRGWSDSGSFCGRFNEQRVYFAMEFSNRADSIDLYSGNELVNENSAGGPDVYAVIHFGDEQEVLMRVGISYTGMEKALLNLRTETAGLEWDFDGYRAQARDKWNKELGKVTVSGGSSDDLTVFYTALYHQLLQPGIFSDVDGTYLKMGSDKTSSSDFTRYHVYSLWDTYRTVHPFLTLMYPEKQRDMVQTMVGMYSESGWLPKWELAGNETLVMVGDPAAIVISDTYMKGVRDFDHQKAAEAIWMQANFTDDLNPVRPGLDSYLTYGYIPMDYEQITNDRKKPGFVWGPLSTSLEYHFADWSASRFLMEIGMKEEAAILEDRSLGYKNFYDPETMFLRPRYSDGRFLDPFDPLDESSSMGWLGSGGLGYVEGTAWQYNFFVPHDVRGLMELMGGEKPFIERLQKTFDDDHFTIHNEPDMSYPYLFNYTKEDFWRTQKLVHDILKEEYTTRPDGIPGNDDTGTLSGWFAWSAIGLFPDKPGDFHYQITSPMFDEITLQLDPKYHTGKTFRILTEKESENSIYIRELYLNGERYSKIYLSHFDVIKGGELKMVLTDEPAE